MRFGKENAHKKILHSRLTLIVLLIIAVFMLASVRERYIIERQTAKQTANLQTQLEAQQQQRDQLQKQVDYLQNPRGEEQEIRRNFDVAKPGEQVIILTGTDGVSATTATTALPTARPWYQFW